MTEIKEWQEEGAKLASISNNFWELGDWLIGKSLTPKILGTDYDKAVEITGLDRITLKKIATVCKSIPKEMRIPDLSFEHHQAIASCNKPEQIRKWLTYMKDLPSPPSVKLLKLSVNTFPDNPKVIDLEAYTNKKKRVNKDNYIPHLNRLFSILRKTVPDMDDDQIKALKKDTEGFVELLKRL